MQIKRTKRKEANAFISIQLQYISIYLYMNINTLFFVVVDEKNEQKKQKHACYIASTCVACKFKVWLEGGTY